MPKHWGGNQGAELAIFELHCWIASKIMGWRHVTSDDPVNRPGKRWIRHTLRGGRPPKCLVGMTFKLNLPPKEKPCYGLSFVVYEPTVNIAQAMDVANRLRSKGWSLWIQDETNGRWRVSFGSGSICASVEHKNLAYALCLAAKEAYKASLREASVAAG